MNEHSLSLDRVLVTDGIGERLGGVLRDWGELSVVPLAAGARAALAGAAG